MTQIEWVLNPDDTRGITVNHKTGCLNHTPEGLCLGGMFPCYAYRLANGRLKQRYLANKNWDTSTQEGYEDYPNLDPFYPRLWSERLEQIRKIKKPTGIFLNDMADWMGSYWSRKSTEAELQVMRDCPQHRLYTLTKQPQNLPQWSPFPDNCWVGVTITNRTQMNELYHLCYIQAGKRFISFEPLLERINPTAYTVGIPWAGGREKGGRSYSPLIDHIDWVIIGSQTKPYQPPPIEAVEEIVRACDKAGVAVFLKDNLSQLIPVNSWLRYGAAGELRLRQEMPAITS